MKKYLTLRTLYHCLLGLDIGYILCLMWFNLKNFPLTENASDNVIKTGIDGYTQIYSVNDIVPQLGKDGKLSVTLYENIVENWPEQQLLNKVSVLGSVMSMGEIISPGECSL